MANQLKMDKITAITCLRKRGWSKSRIARELGVHRITVSRYVKSAGESDSKSTLNPPPGNLQNRQNPTPGNSGPASACEPFREMITEKAEVGLSGQRIYQDLVSEQGFSASYSSVRRFIKRLGTSMDPPFRRMESEPGQEAQVDFGKGAPVVDSEGRRHRTQVFRIILSCSRKGYSEAVFREGTEDFIRCLENAFSHFGGVPATIVIDNLRAAVSKADWFDPELNPKVESFCRHYGCVILPAKPYTPRHKGKVERGIGYVQDNALKGRVFKGLVEENEHLLNWETNVADKRIHGTTRKQVGKVFEDVERRALLPLPVERFPYFKEARRAVHRDAHVEVDKSYYSVPPEYVGREVCVRWDAGMVRVFNHRFEQIAVHAKKEPGQFSTDRSHISSKKISTVELGTTVLLRRAILIGSNANRWAEAMLKERGIAGVRVLIGLLSLARKYGSEEIDGACERALSHGAFRLKAVRVLLERSDKQTTMGFIEEHPVIRAMSDYGRIVKVSFTEDGKGEIVPIKR